MARLDSSATAGGLRPDRRGVELCLRNVWLDLNEGVVTTERGPDSVALTAHINDRDGATWKINREIRPGLIDGVIAVDVQIQVNTDREVICIPWLTVLPGLDTFGQDKEQALFAGLEYLSDEPSSSEADITTPEHLRRVPDPIKVTFPLMTISIEGRYVGLVWNPSEWINPLFDSPDRIFGSGAHVMALTGPAVGKGRNEPRLARFGGIGYLSIISSSKNVHIPIHNLKISLHRQAVCPLTDI